MQAESGLWSPGAHYAHCRGYRAKWLLHWEWKLNEWPLEMP